MTRDEALQALKAGSKITHVNFTAEEYLYMVDGWVMTEDGFDFRDEFDRRDMFKDGWSIYEN